MAKHSLRDRFRRKRTSEKRGKKALSSDMRTLLDRFEADYDNVHHKPGHKSRPDSPER